MGKKRSNDDMKFLRKMNEICTRGCEELIEKIAISYNLSQIGIIPDEYKEVLNNRFRESIKEELRKVYVNFLPNPTIIRRMVKRSKEANEKRIDNINVKILRSISNQKERIVRNSASSILLQASEALKLNDEFRNWYSIGSVFLSEMGSELFSEDYVLLERIDYEKKKDLAMQVMSLTDDIIRVNRTSILEGILVNESYSQTHINSLSQYIKKDIISSYIRLIIQEKDKIRELEKIGIEKKLQVNQTPIAQVYTMPQLTPQELDEGNYRNFTSYLDSNGDKGKILDYLIRNKEALYSIREKISQELLDRDIMFDVYRYAGERKDPKRREIARDFNLPCGTRYEYEAKVNGRSRQKVVTN